MGKLELSQAGGSIIGGAVGMLVARRFGGGAAIVGLFVGAIAGMALATALLLLIIWLRKPER